MDWTRYSANDTSPLPSMKNRSQSVCCKICNDSHLSNSVLPDPGEGVIYIENFDIEKLKTDLVWAYVYPEEEYLEQVRLNRYSDSMTATVVLPFTKTPQYTDTGYFFWISGIQIGYDEG